MNNTISTFEKTMNCFRSKKFASVFGVLIVASKIINDKHALVLFVLLRKLPLPLQLVKQALVCFLLFLFVSVAGIIS